MSAKAKSARDAFAFSLRGVAAINSYALAPAVADDRINRAWDERLSPAKVDERLEDQPGMTREIEDFLARFFAPGSCREAA